MPKSEIIPCTREEMDKLIEASMNDDFFYMFFKVARKTGRRLGEYYGEPEKEIIEEIKLPNGKVKKIKKNTGKFNDGVKVKDIDFERKVMMTKVLKRRKKVEREALLDDELVYLLKRYIASNKLGLEDFVFRKVGYRQIQNRIGTYAKKAGIKHKVSFHNFRHFFVTELFKKGFTYDQIAKLTGHSSVQTLAIYDHTVASDLGEEVRNAIKDL